MSTCPATGCSFGKAKCPVHWFEIEKGFLTLYGGGK